MGSLNCYIWNKRICIHFSNTSHVDSLDSFRRSVVDKVKSDLCIFQKGYHYKENNTRIKYADNLV